MKHQIRNILLATLVPLLLVSYVSLGDARVLGVQEIIQEQTQWCWAACSRATLLYYGTNVAQCTIADWARQQNGWGTDNCCTNPSGAICNQSNNIISGSGSILNILQHWGVNSNGRYYALSQATVTSEINAGRPFVFRWGWSGGGGHFMVGRGIDGSTVHYMDPWPGNGYSTASYTWVVSGGSHTWTHTLQLTTNVASTDVWITKWGSPPGSPPPYKTPDIWLATEPPVLGVANTIYARVHNSGPNNAAAVNVEFFVYYFGSGITNWFSVGADIISVTNGSTVNASVSWTPQWSGHSCIKVELTYGNDSNTSNNLAQENYDIETGEGGGWVESQFMIYNPFPEPLQFLAVWDTINFINIQNLELSPTGQFALAPFDSIPGFVGYRFPENAVLGDTSTAHFTQRLVTGEFVGGVTIDFVVVSTAPGVQVVIPNTTGQPGALVDIPLNVVTDVSGMGIISAEIELSWDAAILDNASAVLGSMTSGWSMSFHSPPGSGQMTIWLAGTEDQPPIDDLAGTGSLAMLSFEVMGQHCDTTTIHFDKMVFNEGDPQAITHDGLFHAVAGWDITGHIYYCHNNDHVDDAIVPATIGTLFAVDSTDANGNYELLDLLPDNYEVRPEKVYDLGTPSAISALDAAWILQYGVDLRTFTPCQMIAAEVSGNGRVSAFDAAKILQYNVGIINQFPVMADSTRFWRFVPDAFTLTLANWMTAPNSISYTPLNSNVVDDYKAILYGDVSGNWHPTESSLAKSAAATADIRLENIHGKSGDKVSLPLYLDNASDIVAMNLTLDYDPHVLKALGASVTSLTQEYQLAYNVTDGRIKVALAGSRPLGKSGSVVSLEFEILETESAASPLVISEMMLNEGSISANIQAAEFRVGAPVPTEYALHQNHPNPFNTETVIKYQLPKPGKVSLKIYNSIGQQIRTLVEEIKQAGEYEIHWDGIDENGSKVSSGIYIYRLQAGEFVSIKKMLFLM